MVINSVTIENFRSFYGVQSVSFATDKEKNTTLIYGLNGVGKTNFLNAVLWCLHGMFSAGFANQHDILNREAKRRGRKSYHVTLEFEESGKEYVVKRSGGDIESFKVFVNDEGNYIEITQDPKLFINSIIPKDMAGYFISDGEGGTFSVDPDGMISVKRSIRDILGFNVAEKAVEDLVRIRSELRQELKKFDVDKEFSDLEQKIQICDESIVSNKKTLEDNKSLLERYQVKIDQVNKRLGGSSSAIVKQLQAQRTRAERERENAARSLVSEEGRKVKLIRDYSWVAFSNRIAGEALDFIDESEIKGTIPAPYNLQLVKDILSQAECICGACIEPGTKAYSRIQELLGKAADPDLINRLQRARSRLTMIKAFSSKAKEELEDNYRRCADLTRSIASLDAQIKNHSDQILEAEDEKINELERERTSLERKISETSRAIGRCEQKLDELISKRKEYEERVKRIEGLSPRAKTLKSRIEVVDKIEELINNELQAAESGIHDILKDKINIFMEKYLRQDYKVVLTSDMKIGLEDRNGYLIPPSGGQGAILSFVYISSLISIARERRDMDSSILTPGAIAPLIFDAPFSKLDPKYAPNVAKELPRLVDQLVVLMYPDPSKNIDNVIKDAGKLGRVYYMTEEIAAEQGDKLNSELVIEGRAIPAAVYCSPIDKVIINEASAYD